MAAYATYTLADGPHDIRLRCEGYAMQQRYFMVLDSCQRPDEYGKYQWLVAATLEEPQLIIQADAVPQKAEENWLFGLLPYELKITVEPSTHTRHAPTLPWPEVAFFVADLVCYQLRGADAVVICCRTEDPEAMAERLLQVQPHQIPKLDSAQAAAFSSDFTPGEYAQAVQALRMHIVQGDAYQINLSQQFTAQGAVGDLMALFYALKDASPVGMAAMLRWGSRYVFSISPERFLQHRQGQLTTQPIKGTIHKDSLQDTAAALHASPKERAENVMVVDMARNDLHRSCIPGTVHVPQLHGVHTYSTLHHLVSTVTGTLRVDTSPWQALLFAFPPASMTGTPKVSAMKLIDHYEKTGRGLYAGCMGYMAPDREYDFNVVIRTVQYDAVQHIVLYNVGGAVTYDSNPQGEYEETLLKAQALQTVLGTHVYAVTNKLA